VLAKAFPSELSAPLDVAFAPNGDLLLTGATSGDLDFGGGILPVYGSTAVYVAELTGSGAHVYSRSFAGPDGVGTAILAAGSGGAWVSGVEDGVFDVGTGPIGAAGASVFFVALSPAGATVTARAFPGGAFTDENRVAVHPSGDAILAGGFMTSIDFGNGPLTGSPIVDVYVARCAL
jgi:hypothetical protein